MNYQKFMEKALEGNDVNEAKDYKKVKLTIDVPISDYCNMDSLLTVCKHFNEQYGNISCDLGFDNFEDSHGNTVKDPKCAKLR